MQQDTERIQGMLTLRVGGTDSYDETKSEFVEQDGLLLRFEHSLLSVSKWESIHEKPFLGNDEKSADEITSYIRCMCLDDNIAPEVFKQLTKKNYDDINAYLESKQTATWFNEQPGAPQSREVITAELIYYWLTVFKIPFECQHWHLNRLFTLIRICNVKQGKPKKMSRAEVAARNRELNARRRAQLGTTG
jgi:hypothetical protein